MNTPAVVTLNLSLCETESLVSFMADRKELWLRHGKECGLDDPEDTLRHFIDAHRVAVRQTARGA